MSKVNEIDAKVGAVAPERKPNQYDFDGCVKAGVAWIRKSKKGVFYLSGFIRSVKNFMKHRKIIRFRFHHRNLNPKCFRLAAWIFSVITAKFGLKAIFSIINVSLEKTNTKTEINRIIPFILALKSNIRKMFAFLMTSLRKVLQNE
jgi:hypothetical protein